MNFDKWYEKQSKVLKIVLVAVPFVNWIMEILIRLSIYLRTKKTIDLVFFIVYAVFTYPLFILDIVWLAIKGHIFGTSDFEDLTDDKEHVDGEKKPEEPKEEKPEEEK